MVIGAVIALCVLLLILAFLFPRLSRHPEHGSQRALGLGSRGASKAPGKLGRWFSKPFTSSSKAVSKERRHRPQGPVEDAVLMPGAGFEPARPFGQGFLRAPSLPFLHPGGERPNTRL